MRYLLNMEVVIAPSAHAAMLSHAEADHPLEACGILYGSQCEVTAVEAAVNVAPDPYCAFEIDPAALIAAAQRSRSGGQSVAGWYHAHPNGARTPSQADAAGAREDGRLWLILAAGAVTAWRAQAGGALHGRFEPLGFRVG